MIFKQIHLRSSMSKISRIFLEKTLDKSRFLGYTDEADFGGAEIT